jgi:carbonic anhydrase
MASSKQYDTLCHSQVRFSGDAGRLVINGTAYRLRQLHWHTPSEHTVDGRRYDMELHLVHESAENKAAVIGMFYEVGAAPDPFLKKLEPAIKRVRDTRDREEPIGLVDPSGARATGSVYYRYMGSLTTPPCTEGVVWTVFHKVHALHGWLLWCSRPQASKCSICAGSPRGRVPGGASQGCGG